MILPGEEDLPFTVDVYDERGNYVRILAKVADLMTGLGAFNAAARRYPGEYIFLRHKARVLQKREG